MSTPNVGALSITGYAPTAITAAQPVGPVSGIAPGLPGGVDAVLNVLTVQTIKAAPGLLYRVTVVTAGSGGSLTLNDAASLATATTQNSFFTAANSALTAGTVLTLEWPCAAGITISSVPTGAQLALSFS